MLTRIYLRRFRDHLAGRWLSEFLVDEYRNSCDEHQASPQVKTGAVTSRQMYQRG